MGDQDIHHSQILEATLEHTDHGMSMVDGDLKFIALNSKFKELFGLPDSFNVGHTLADFIRHNAENGVYGDVDVEAKVKELADPARHFKKRKLERTRPDGTIIEICIIPVESGGQVSTYIDVTERRRAERILRENEMRLREIFEISPAGVGISVDGKAIYGNSKMLELRGCKDLEDFYETPTIEAYANPADRENLIKRMETEKFVEDCEIEVKRKDGSTFWSLFSLFPIEFEGQKGLINWIFDISEQKEAEETQARQNEIIEATLENVGQGIVMVDAEGTTIAHNHYFEEMFDQGVKDYPNFEEYTRVYLESVGADSDSIEKSLQLLRDNVEGTWERPLPDGRTFEISHTAIEGGGYVRSYNDISERKNVENEVKLKMQEAEAFNKVAVGRELKMIELKKEINELNEELGKAERYQIVS